MSPQLEVVSGAEVGRRIVLDGDLLIGRTVDGEGRVDDEEVSRRHARVSADASGDLTVEDLGSANGTWVNEERVTGSQGLSAGDRVRIGNTTLLVGAPEPEPPPEPAGAATKISDPPPDPPRDATRIGDPPPPEPPGDATRIGDPPPPDPPGDATRIGDPPPPDPPADATRIGDPPPAQRPPAGGGLEVIGGEAAGRRLYPDPELVLGRVAEGDGRLDHDPDASRRHARVRRADDGTLEIEDLGSANGTWVNEERLEGVRALVPGDTVRVGQTQIRVTDSPGEPPSAPAPVGPTQTDEPPGAADGTASGAPRRRRRRTWLVIAGAALLLLLIASQILLPSMASDRLRDRLERQGEVSSVEVSAFPAAKLLFGRADEVNVRMASLTIGGAGGGSGGSGGRQGAVADAIDRTSAVGRLDVSIGTLTAGPLTVRDARVTKRDGTLRTEALVSADALRDALPPALDLEPAATPDGELVLEGTLRARGIEIDGKADVLARDGKLILQPDGPGFIPLPSITVLDDPRLNLTDVGAEARDGDFVIRAEGTTR